MLGMVKVCHCGCIITKCHESLLTVFSLSLSLYESPSLSSLPFYCSQIFSNVMGHLAIYAVYAIHDENHLSISLGRC